MMIPSRQQRCARRGTKCGDVKSIVAQSPGREFIKRRRRDRSSERGWISESRIIDQHEQNVRRICWGLNRLGKRRYRSFERPFRNTFKGLRRARQNRSIPFRI
jgi:hypothetical protein